MERRSIEGGNDSLFIILTLKVLTFYQDEWEEEGEESKNKKAVSLFYD